MSYVVIKHFTDLQDKNYAYNVGDAYPRKGLSPAKKRIDELLGKKNKQGVPLIEEIKKAKASGNPTEEGT